MPIKNLQDAVKAHEHIGEISNSDYADDLVRMVCRLSLNLLGFKEQRGSLALHQTHCPARSSRRTYRRATSSMCR